MSTSADDSPRQTEDPENKVAISWALDHGLAVALILLPCFALSVVPRFIPHYQTGLRKELRPDPSKPDPQGFLSPIGRLLENPARTDMTVTDCLRSYPMLLSGKCAMDLFPQPVGSVRQGAAVMVLFGVYLLAYFAIPLFALRVAWQALVLLYQLPLTLLAETPRPGESRPARLFATLWVLVPLAPLAANAWGLVRLQAFSIFYLSVVSLATLDTLCMYVRDKWAAIENQKARSSGGAGWQGGPAGSKERTAFRRIPETELIGCSLTGGWLGALAGQEIVRHKIAVGKSLFRLSSRILCFIHALVVAALVALALWEATERSDLRLKQPQVRMDPISHVNQVAVTRIATGGRQADAAAAGEVGRCPTPRDF